MTSMMVGRRVRCKYTGVEGTTVQWKPLGASMNDILVREDGGRECWYASHGMRALGGYPLPCRKAAVAAAEERAARQLRQIRADLIAEWNRPWPGLEHGKAILGLAIDGALKSLESK